MAKALKIAFLSVFHPFRGGIAQFNNALFESLQEQAEVKAFNFTTQYPKVLFPGKTQYVDVADKPPSFSNQRVLSSINPLTFQKTIAAIDEYAPDVLITAYWMPFFGPSLGWISKKVGKSIFKLSIVHNAIPHERKLGDKLLSNFYFKQQNAFAVLSETVKNDLKILAPTKPVFLRQHPLYAQFGEKQDRQKTKAQLGINSDQKVLLFFGFIRKYKGLDLLLQALPFLEPNVHLIIAGECYGDFEAYQNIISDNNLTNKITNLVRYIPDAEVAAIFSASDLCVLPYRTATQSGIASIAKYYQLPMVVTPVGELPNEVIDRKTGVVCDSSDPQSIAKAVTYGLNHLHTFKTALQADQLENTWDNFSSHLLQFIHKHTV